MNIQRRAVGPQDVLANAELTLVIVPSAHRR
jgi:hypothetical protein